MAERRRFRVFSLTAPGLLSYLALGFAGLFLERKRLWRALREAYGMAVRSARRRRLSD